MVSISAKGANGRRRRGRSAYSVGVMEVWVVLILVCLFAGYAIVSLYSFSSGSLITGHLSDTPRIRKEDQERAFSGGETAPSLHLENEARKENPDFFDTKAYDIMEMLSCSRLLESKTPVWKSRGYVYGNAIAVAAAEENEGGEQPQRHRRLDDQKGEQKEEILLDTYDDDVGNTSELDGAYVTAAHLFCESIAEGDTSFWKDKLKCSAKTEDLLDLWSDARTEFTEAQQLLHVLELATERSTELGSQRYNIWAPLMDDSTVYMTETINTQVRENQRLANLHENLGGGRLFVDVGSGLGYTAMIVAQLYPDTDIVSIEPSPQNWLMQRLNFLCNDFEKQPISILRAGVGSSARTFQRAHFVWRPTQTTATRGWPFTAEDNNVSNPSDPEDDVTFTAELWPWHKILAITEVTRRTIDVLNLDCEGCEYNLIPVLSDEEFFEDIRSCIGELHWSYIPTLKRPSSKTAATTHERLCQHEDFANQAIECCAFPDAQVKATISGEVLAHEDNVLEKVTVADLIGESLCPTFQAWAEEHNLFSVESDWAWLQVNAMGHR